MSLNKITLAVAKNFRNAKRSIFQKSLFTSSVRPKFTESAPSEKLRKKCDIENGIDYSKKFSFGHIGNNYFGNFQPKLLPPLRLYSTSAEPKIASKRVYSISTKLRRLRDIPSYYFRQYRANQKPEPPKYTRRSVQSYKYNPPYGVILPMENKQKTPSEKTKFVCLSCGKPKNHFDFTKSMTSTLAEQHKLDQICQKCGKERLNSSTCSGEVTEKEPKETKVCKECGQKILSQASIEFRRTSSGPPKPVVQLSKPFQYEDIPKCSQGRKLEESQNKKRCEPTPPIKFVCEPKPPATKPKFPEPSSVCKAGAKQLKSPSGICPKPKPTVKDAKTKGENVKTEAKIEDKKDKPGVPPKTAKDASKTGLNPEKGETKTQTELCAPKRTEAKIEDKNNKPGVPPKTVKDDSKIGLKPQKVAETKTQSELCPPKSKSETPKSKSDVNMAKTEQKASSSKVDCLKLANKSESDVSKAAKQKSASGPSSPKDVKNDPAKDVPKTKPKGKECKSLDALAESIKKKEANRKQKDIPKCGTKTDVQKAKECKSLDALSDALKKKEANTGSKGKETEKSERDKKHEAKTEAKAKTDPLACFTKPAKDPKQVEAVKTEGANKGPNDKKTEKSETDKKLEAKTEATVKKFPLACYTKDPIKVEVKTEKTDKPCGVIIKKPQPCTKPIDITCVKEKKENKETETSKKESTKHDCPCFTKAAKKGSKSSSDSIKDSKCDIKIPSEKTNLCPKHAAEVKAAEAKSAEAKSAEAKSAEAKSAEAKSAEVKSAEAKSAEAKSVEAKSAKLKSATDGISTKFVPKCKPDEFLERGICLKTAYLRCQPSQETKDQNKAGNAKGAQKSESTSNKESKCPFECPNSKCPFMSKLPKELLECICKECNSAAEQKEPLLKLKCICKKCVGKKLKKKKFCCADTQKSKTCSLTKFGPNDFEETLGWDIPAYEGVGRMLEEDFKDVRHEDEAIQTIKEIQKANSSETIEGVAPRRLMPIIPLKTYQKRGYSGSAKPRKCCCHARKSQDESKYQWKKENQPMKPSCTSSKLRCSCSLDDVDNKKTIFQPMPCSCGWKRFDDKLNKGCLRCGQVRKYHTERPSISQMTNAAWYFSKRFYQTFKLSSVLATAPRDFFPSEFQPQSSSECEKKTCKLKPPEKKLKALEKKSSQQQERCECGKKKNHVGPCLAINKCTLTDCLCADCNGDGVTVVIRIPDEATKKIKVEAEKTENI